MPKRKTFPPVRRHAPLVLWSVVAGVLNTLFGLFGQPQDLAKNHALIRRWLRAGEALVRRVLLIASGPSFLPPRAGEVSSRHAR